MIGRSILPKVKRTPVKIELVCCRSGITLPVDGRVSASTLEGAQRELNDLWLSEEIVGVRIVRFNGELAGWYRMEAK
jgi:hypothetical protein